MAEENDTTPLFPGDILDRETFDHLQLSAVFRMLVDESVAGESRAFGLLRRLIENGLTATALKKGDPEEDDTDDAYCVPANDLMEALAEVEKQWQVQFEMPAHQWANDDGIWTIDQIWRIKVTGIPDSYYTNLGMLWVSEDNYCDACARLGATHYRWPKYPWSTELVDRAVPTRRAIPTEVPTPTLRETVREIASSMRWGRKAECVREIVGVILDAAERRIPGFNRNSIPGKYVDLLEFCKTLEPTLFQISPKTLYHYVKGRLGKYRVTPLCSFTGKGEPPAWEAYRALAAQTAIHRLDDLCRGNEAKLGRLLEAKSARIAEVKGIYAGWEQFCEHLGVGSDLVLRVGGFEVMERPWATGAGTEHVVPNLQTKEAVFTALMECWDGDRPVSKGACSTASRDESHAG